MTTTANTLSGKLHALRRALFGPARQEHGRRNPSGLDHLSDHLLRDIGLRREDLIRPDIRRKGPL